MRKTLLTIVLMGLFISKISAQIIIDHRHTDIHAIPDRWIDSAQNKLVVYYGHASHGSHITMGGMSALMNYSTAYQEKYRYNADGSNGGLRIIEQYEQPWYDLSHNAHDWYDITISNLTAYPEVNVVMWAWSGMEGQDIDAYLTQMEQLISIYGTGGSAGRNVQFVFQTGNNDSEYGETVVASRKQIKDHCMSHNRFLFDFTDIEAYNPDGDFFGDYDSDGNILPRSQRYFLNEDISYNMDGVSTPPGNWGIEWMEANPDDELTALAADDVCTICAHSMGGDDDNSRLHCILKGMAGWYLFARLAGWDGDGSASPVQDIDWNSMDIKLYPNPLTNSLTVQLEHYSTTVSIQIIDILGNILIQEEFSSTKKNHVINTGNLSRGLYFVKVDGTNFSLSKLIAKE